MHRNAPLTLEGRRRLVERIEKGWSITAAAKSMCISRQCASKWWNRYLAEGETGLADRSSRPHRCPHQTPKQIENKIIRMRRKRRLGPARLGGELGIASTTVHAVLVRHGLNRLAWIDRPTGRKIRRIHTDRPGELVHIDVKKLAKIPDGGGQRTGRTTESKRRSRQKVGYAYIHTAIDAYSRLAYSEFAGKENRDNCVAFLHRANAWFNTQHGITIERILTDNGNGYKSHAWRDTCADLGIKHTKTKPYHPATNGKVERFNRTIVEEWAYAKVWTSDKQRARTFDGWLNNYNYRRHHTAINGTPIETVNNHPG